MSALEIVDIQMNELKNDKNNSGIKVAYFFASPENKSSTGPFYRFREMVKNDTYKHLINNKSYQILNQKIKNKEYYIKTRVLSKFDNNYHNYLFILTQKNGYDKYSNKYLYNYFRTDTVVKIN